MNNTSHRIQAPGYRCPALGCQCLQSRERRSCEHLYPVWIGKGHTQGNEPRHRFGVLLETDWPLGRPYREFVAENAEHATGGAESSNSGWAVLYRPRAMSMSGAPRIKDLFNSCARNHGQLSSASDDGQVKPDIQYPSSTESNACHVAYIDVEGQIGKPDSLTDWVRAFAQRLERSFRLPRGSVTTRTEHSEPQRISRMRSSAHLPILTDGSL